MSNVKLPNPDVTLLRVRQVVDTDDILFMRGLSVNELADMVMCACSFINSLARVLPAGFVETLFTMINTEEWDD